MIITAGKFKGRKIVVPDEKITRPTLSKVRMGVFNTLQAMIDFEGKSFLDMYAGSGIMGLEALSRGFSHAAFIEKNPKAAKILKANVGEVIVGDSLKIAPKLGYFDVVYIDPPYGQGIYEASLKAANSGIFILEHVENVDLTGFTVLKQKKYGDKLITVIKRAD